MTFYPLVGGRSYSQHLFGHVSEKVVPTRSSVSPYFPSSASGASPSLLFNLLPFLLQSPNQCEKSSMGDKAIPTEVSAVKRDGSREATGGSDDSVKSVSLLSTSFLLSLFRDFIQGLTVQHSRDLYFIFVKFMPVIGICLWNSGRSLGL